MKITAKYFIEPMQTVVFALRFKNDIMSLGGYNRNLDVAIVIMHEYFSEQVKEPKFTQRNKFMWWKRR